MNLAEGELSGQGKIVDAGTPIQYTTVDTVEVYIPLCNNNNKAQRAISLGEISSANNQ